ncbi:MAG: MBL fold metallo-hydrolase [Anaerolineae bacterium]|nr:MAG: MBL fold metallo-hydrolase [Anaerolineae bacterium]
MMYLQQFFVEGLGCASYLIGCEKAGVAAVIDPDRDVRRYVDAAASRGLTITHIIETHLHADHVSGNTDLAARTGASIYIHQAAQARFSHQPLEDGDLIQLGNVAIEVLHTPGHTPESVTLLIADTMRSSEPWLALTGDTLFVGDVGRPDLVGDEAARELAEHLHASLFDRLLQLPDSLLVYPGHGAGSLCGRSIGSMRSTTLGFERRANPSLAVREKDDFVEFMTHNLPEQPGNHQRIKALNRRGPQPLGEIVPRPLSLQEAILYLRRGAALLDTRPRAAFVERHIPGAVRLPADDRLSNRVGFVLPPAVPLVLLTEDEEAYHHVVLSLARVGYEQVVGYLTEGMAGWEAAGLPVTSGDIQDITAAELNVVMSNGNGLIVVDVREPWEYRQGHVPGARLMPLGDLAARVGELDSSQPTAVICASGNRSQSAAALLGQKGFAKVYNVLGGVTDWASAGFPLEHN